MTRLFAVLLLSTAALMMVLIVGCSRNPWIKHIAVDGFEEIQEDHYKDAVAKVKKRASFETDCPEAQLQVSILDVDPGNCVSQLGVKGCGKKMVYVNAASYYCKHQWVANTDVKGD